MKIRGRFGPLLPLTLLLLLTGCAKSADGRAEPNEALVPHELARLPREGVNTIFADFGGKVHLLGYTVEPGERVRSGERITLKLYWSSVAPLSPGYRLSTYLIAGRRIDTFESGGPLRQSETGPSAWRPGKIYVDEQQLEVPDDLKAREFAIAVGISRDAPAGETELASGSSEEGASEEGAVTISTLRLPVIGGQTDGSERAIVTHLQNEHVVKPKARARRTPSMRAPVPRRENPSP